MRCFGAIPGMARQLESTPGRGWEHRAHHDPERVQPQSAPMVSFNCFPTGRPSHREAISCFSHDGSRLTTPAPLVLHMARCCLTMAQRCLR